MRAPSPRTQPGASAQWHRLSVVSDVLEALVSVHTPGPDHARRAVDVNRPVTSQVRSCYGAGRAGTNHYRGIDIPRSRRPLFCGDGKDFKAIGLWLRSSKACVSPSQFRPPDTPTCPKVSGILGGGIRVCSGGELWRSDDRWHRRRGDRLRIPPRRLRV